MELHESCVYLAICFVFSMLVWAFSFFLFVLDYVVFCVKMRFFILWFSLCKLLVANNVFVVRCSICFCLFQMVGLLLGSMFLYGSAILMNFFTDSFDWNYHCYLTYHHSGVSFSYILCRSIPYKQFAKVSYISLPPLELSPYSLLLVWWQYRD